MSQISKEQAIQVLYEEAKKIQQLIQKQQNHLCISQCKAFEEVIDTQMYGYSKQVTYAVKIGILTANEGHQMLSELEKSLNDFYNEVYDEQKEKSVGAMEE